MNLGDIESALGSRWRCVQRLARTTLFIHDQDPYTDQLLPPINAYKYENKHTEFNTVLMIQPLIKRIKFGGSLCRFWLGQGDLLAGFICCYRFKPHEFRMMQLLAEPPVPTDILRHIYCFMK
jgi:hypothetical protein